MRPPDIDSLDIRIAVHNGVLALVSFVRSYGQKIQAVRDMAGLVNVTDDEVRALEVDHSSSS